MSFRRRLLLLLPAVLFAAAAVWLLVAPLLRAPAPSAEQWLEAASLVRQSWQAGDVVRLEPAHLTAGRVFFADLDGGKRAPMRILDLHDPVDWPFLYRFKRLWLVTAIENRGDEEELAPPGSNLAEKIELDTLTVTRWELPADVLKWGLVEAAATAQVTREDKEGKQSACPWRHGRHTCQMGGRMDVAAELRRVAGGPRECLLVRPGPGPNPVRLTFPLEELEGTLLVRFGNTIEAARAGEGGDTVVEVSAGGPVERVVVARRDYALHEVRIALAPQQGLKELVIAVHATDDRKRELCLDGYVVAAGLTAGTE
jgi:hypothetical protein